jgi:hypothetical protein
MNQKRYLGLELSGAKNAKTTLAVLEYYPREKKVFVLDIHSGIGADANGNSDEALIQTIQDHANDHPSVKLGVNVPLTLPPSFLPAKKGQSPLDSLEVKWMQSHFTKKQNPPTSKRTAKLKDFFTPYTQRPIEIWLKNEVLAKIPQKLRFEIDETLGGNKAPLTARMQFLKHYLTEYELHEVLPKLTAVLLMPSLKLSQKTLMQYRQLEDGVSARQTILDRMSETAGIFIYDRDQKKITQNLNAFDAFLCAYTVLLHDRNDCVTPPKHFPLKSGWIRYPKSPFLDSHLSALSNFADEDAEADENEGEEA